MGQYYNILTYKNNNYIIYDRSVKKGNEKPKYEFAKIMEHSWIGNSTMRCISAEIYMNPTKLAWVGDYADECTEEDMHNPNLNLSKALDLHQIAWKSKATYLIEKAFNVKDMILINWDKKEYVNMKEYINENTFDGWCIHPLSLLTALGNGFGGGDYNGINEETVGYWCFDTISFENNCKEQEFLNNNFKKLNLQFKENWQNS